MFDLLAIQGTLKSLFQHHSSKASILWHSGFFMVQLSHPYMTTGKTINSVQSLSRIQLFATPWTAACQASLSTTNSWSLLKLMSIALVMPSNHLILCHPFLLPLSILPNIRIFSNESVLCIRWPKYWSFSFSNYYIILYISLPLHYDGSYIINVHFILSLYICVVIIKNR